MQTSNQESTNLILDQIALIGSGGSSSNSGGAKPGKASAPGPPTTVGMSPNRKRAKSPSEASSNITDPLADNPGTFDQAMDALIPNPEAFDTLELDKAMSSHITSSRVLSVTAPCLDFGKKGKLDYTTWWHAVWKAKGKSPWYNKLTALGVPKIFFDPSGTGKLSTGRDNIGKVIMAWPIYSGALPPCPHLGIANVRKKAPTGTPKWL